MMSTICTMARVAAALMLLGAGVPTFSQSTFTHRIPINLPKGANGTQPELALVYDPTNPNGILGVGWTLSGLPVITRVNNGNGISYSGFDTYADSNFGVLVKQSDGTFRTKRESFVKYVPSGTSDCGDGPCSWVASYPSGTKYTYGGPSSPGVGSSSTTSQLKVQNSSSVRTWALSSVTDVFGNSFEVTYINDAPNGQIYPSVLTYTKASNISTYRTVTFTYQARMDTEPGYYQSAFQRTTQRLQWITVSTGVTSLTPSGSLVRKYRLSYESGASTARSRLVSVQEYGDDGVSVLPAQTFVWQEGTSASIHAHGNGYASPVALGSGVQVVDLDGDGKPDIIQGYNGARTAYLNTGSSWATNVAYAPPADFVVNSFDAGLRFVDLNGDGRPDLVQAWTYNTTAYHMAWINNGNKNCTTPGCAWTPAPQYAPPPTAYFSGATTYWGGYDLGVRIMDLDGDGRADLVQGNTYTPLGTQNRNAWINNGNTGCTTLGCAWSAAPQYAPPADFVGMSGPGAAFDAGLRAVDLDGDGRADLVQGWYNYGTSYRNAWVNNGNTGCTTTGCRWSSASQYVPPADFAGRDSGWPGGWDSGLRIVDINKDGRPDLIQGWYNYGTSYRNAWTNTGNTSCATIGCYWNAAPGYAPLADFTGRDGSAQRGWDSGMRIVDLNGDGKPDLVQGWSNYGTSYRNAWENNGSSACVTSGCYWSSATPYVPPVDFSGRNSSAPGGWDNGVQYTDVNGDGAPDILELGDAWVRSGPKPDLLATVNNGLGGTVTISYAAAPLVANAIAPNSTAPGIPNTSPQDLVLSVVSSDGRGSSYATSFNYYDARIYPGALATQRNLGFARIDTIDNQTGQATRTFFNQAPGYEGSPSEVDVLAARGQVVSKTAYAYELVHPNSGTEFLREKVKSVATFELGTPSFTQTTTTDSYDDSNADYAGPTSKTQCAGSSAPDGSVANVCVNPPAGALPVVVIATTYVPYDQFNYIFGRISDIKTTSGGTKLGEVYNVWNNNNITSKSEWLDVPPQPGEPCPAWPNGGSGCAVTTAMTYDANGNLWTVTEPLTGDAEGRVTTTVWDSTYHAYPARVTNALNQSTSRTYYPNGLVWASIDLNNQTTTNYYDVFGRKWRESRPDGGSTYYSYVSYGNPGTPSGDITNAQYNQIATLADGTGRVLIRREYFDGSGFKYKTLANGDCGTSVTASGLAVDAGKTYQYVVVESRKDPAGRPYMNSQPYCSTDAPVWTTTTYDDAGRPWLVQTPDTYCGSPGPNCVPTSNPKSMQYTYGTNYRGVIDVNGHETRKYFDARQNVSSVVDAAGQATSYVYDALNRLKTVTLPAPSAPTVYTIDTLTTRLSYDSLSRKTSATSTPGIAPVITTYYYDALGNLLTQTSGGTSVTYTYDPLNRVLTKSASGEAAVSYSYDDSRYTNAVGHLTTLDDAGGTTHFSYDAMGRPAGASRSVDNNTLSLARAYDFAGREGRLTYPDGSYASYAFTDGGNLSALYLTSAGMSTQAIIAQWPTYDASGRPLSSSYGNTVTTTYGYDGMGHLTSLATSNSAGSLQNLYYDWYSRPNTGGLHVASITDYRPTKIVNGINTDETQLYDYDVLYRLSQAADPNAWGIKSYSYDALGNPTTFGGIVNRTLGFTGTQLNSGTGLSGVVYDALGNLTDKQQDGVTWHYTWTAEGFLSTAQKNGQLTAQMTYDANGMRVKKVYTPATGAAVTTTYVGQFYEKRSYGDGSPERHTINLFAHGQLIASVTTVGNIITASNSQEWRNQVALGSMYHAASPLGIVRKAYHLTRAFASHPWTVRWGGALLFAVLAASLLLPFVRGIARRTFAGTVPTALRIASLCVVVLFGGSACSNGRLGSSTSDPILSGDTTTGLPAGTVYYHRNHINSSTVITTSTGAEVTRIVYLPFGEISQANSTGVDSVTSKFTGKEFDEETGLYAMGARYYDPAVGRFVSADSVVPSLTDAQAFNRYSYARNNPIVYVDPSGHFFEFVTRAFNAAARAVGAFSRALGQAVDWAGHVANVVGKFVANAAKDAWLITRSMASNRMVGLGFLLAVAISIATCNPGPLIIWAEATAASIAAQAVAIAAGVRDPTVLSIIASVAGVAAGAGSLGQFLKGITAAGISMGLAAAEGKAARWLAPLNALAAVMVVNGLDNASTGHSSSAKGNEAMSLDEAQTRAAAADVELHDSGIVVADGDCFQYSPKAEGWIHGLSEAGGGALGGSLGGGVGGFGGYLIGKVVGDYIVEQGYCLPPLQPGGGRYWPEVPPEYALAQD